MAAYLIDATFGFVAWVLIILLIWGIIKLFKKEKLHTINFKTVFLISLIGVISPTFNLIGGQYQTNPGTEISESDAGIEISESDKASLKTIIQSCLSGYEISADTHSQFYLLVDKNKMSQSDIDVMFSLIYSENLVLLQKSFYEDALKTIQTGQISESKSRLELEEKLLNDSQKQRNKEYLRKISSNEPIEINGEYVILDEETCNAIIDNIDNIFKVGIKNINTLKNRDAFL